MLLTRVERVGNSAALLLPEQILKLLNINFGDELEISTEANQRLVIQTPSMSERKELIKKAKENVFKKRASVYQRLAEGVSE